MKTKDTIISFRRKWDKQGYVYDQQIRMGEQLFLNLLTLVSIEIKNGKPNKNKYVSTSGYEMYLKELERDGNFCFLNHAQTRYINLYLNIPLKDRNTRILISGNKPATHYQYRNF